MNDPQNVPLDDTKIFEKKPLPLPPGKKKQTQKKDVLHHYIVPIDEDSELVRKVIEKLTEYLTYLQGHKILLGKTEKNRAHVVGELNALIERSRSDGKDIELATDLLSLIRDVKSGMGKNKLLKILESIEDGIRNRDFKFNESKEIEELQTKLEALQEENDAAFEEKFNKRLNQELSDPNSKINQSFYHNFLNDFKDPSSQTFQAMCGIFAKISPQFNQPPTHNTQPYQQNNYVPPTHNTQPYQQNNYVPPTHNTQPYQQNNYVPPTHSTQPNYQNNEYPPTQNPQLIQQVGSTQYNNSYSPTFFQAPAQNQNFTQQEEIPAQTDSKYSAPSGF